MSAITKITSYPNKPGYGNGVFRCPICDDNDTVSLTTPIDAEGKCDRIIWCSKGHVVVSDNNMQQGLVWKF